MNVTVESTGALERRMRVEVPLERIESEVDSRLKQIRQEVIGEVMQKSYSDAVTQEKLRPAGGPKIETEGDDGTNFAYVATFEVLPDIELKDLDKIKVEKPDVEIGDQDLDDMLLSLRKQRATWKEVDRKSKDGDQVVVDFTGTIDGEEFQGGTGKEIPVVLGTITLRTSPVRRLSSRSIRIALRKKSCPNSTTSSPRRLT
jgi:trigger factor